MTVKTSFSLQNVFKNMLKSALLLGFFGLLGTAMVVSVHSITKDQIKTNIKASLLNNLNKIIPEASYNNNLLNSTIEIPIDPLLGNSEPTTVYRAMYDNIPIAVAFDIISPDGYSGKIKLLIAIKSDASISAVRVISHKETPGLGDKIEIKRSNWISSFDGKSLNNTDKKSWKVKKDGGEFDQFTGATITPRAIVKAVYNALRYFKKNQANLLRPMDMESLYKESSN